MPSLISRAALLLILFSGMSAPAAAPDAAPEAATAATKKSLVQARKWMVSSANPLASEAGRQMLREGGSAVDAAIAMQMVLALVEPQSSGIGGGAFLVHYDATTRKVTTYDGRETAPAGVDPRWFRGAAGKPLPFAAASVGGHAVGVPGLLPAELEGRERLAGAPGDTGPGERFTVSRGALNFFCAAASFSR
ncbi:MAG: gamma-glutamyltransferase, partial [Burkholderiaceae bacterium]